jgi:uncharacterized protein (DUF927 family)
VPDPFKHLAESNGAPKPAADAPPPDGELVAPIPAGAPPRLETHKAHGRPSTWWTYRDPLGEPLGYVARFDQADGSKVVLPLTLWREAGRLRWRWKAVPEPRPLYGLQRLAAQPSATVLVVEGEKTADAASERLAAVVAVTWPGGSKAVAKADWRSLAGRRVVIWPDADAPGDKAGRDVERRALAAGALSVGVVRIPAALPDGWDLADDWPPGLGLQKAEALIAASIEVAQPGGVEWPHGFRMEAEGLFYDLAKDGGVVPQRLSAPFEVLAEARDEAGGGWSVVVGFEDRDGRSKTVVVSRARLAAGSAEVRADLSDQGLVVSPARGKADKFGQALAEVRCARRMRLAPATGWSGPRFVLPGFVTGQADGESVLFTGEASGLHYGRAGSLQGWREGVAAVALGNDLLTFALSLAFLGPLLRFLDIEGGGVHLRGASSIGKSTLAKAAGSVWGGLGFAQSWRNTANALEMLAMGHNDSLLVLDELALVAPEEAGAAAYMLASGQAKGRSKADGSLRRRAEWRTSFLSTGEISLADHIRSSVRGGDRSTSGQELRLLDVAADAGAGRGIWQELHGRPGPAELSEAVSAACERDHGHAGPAYVERLAANRAAGVLDAKLWLAQFLDDVLTPDDTGQAHRAAVRFGAIAAAGELASKYGVLPWKAGWAAEVAGRMFLRWAAAFGRDTPREERQMLRRLKAVIESERSAFSPIAAEDIGEDTAPSPGGRDGEARSLKSYGFREVFAGVVRYWFHAEGWAYVFKGFNQQEAARVAAAAGFLEADGDGKHMTRRRKIRGERHRLYCVNGAILEADFGD